MTRNVLVTGDPQMDFLAESLLCGLYEIPDVEVYEMAPWQHVRGGVDQGYDLPHSPGGGCTHTPGYLLPNPLPPHTHTREEIFDLADDFDALILLSTRDYSLRGLAEFTANAYGRRMPRPTCQPLIVCDGEDGDRVDLGIVQELLPDVYFKREFVKGMYPLGHVRELGCSLYPLPFSAFTRSYPTDIDDSVKEYDLFLSVGNTFPGRMTLVGQMLDYAVKHGLRHWIATNDNADVYRTHPYKDKLASMLGWTEYIRKQAQSKVTASMRGWGRDALHAWEAMSFATATLYADPGIYIPYPFLDRVHCLFFQENCEDLDRVLDLLLQPDNEAYRQQIAQAGKSHCLQYHTNKARAEFMLKVADRVYRGQPISLDEFGIIL